MIKAISIRLIITGLVLTLIGVALANMNCGYGRTCVFLPVVTAPAVMVMPMPTATPTATATATTLPVAPTPTATATATALPVAPTPTATALSVAPTLTATATATALPVAPTATTNPLPQTIVGLAILGDSTQDEYRADNPRGGEYNATTLNWVELLATLRNLNIGAWGQRDEPRRGGYAFNWARSGATSDQMLSAGQHTGARQQILAGEVSHAVIQIGINDFYFSGLGLEIYDGTISGAALQSRLNLIAENIITAARTLHETGRCRVLVAATQDYLTLPVVPELYLTYQDPVGRQRFIDAMTYLNLRIAELSTSEGITYFDFNAAYLAEVNQRLDSEGFLIVGGERIDLRTRGNNGRFGLLDDGYTHPGTVLSSLYANVYITEFNQSFNTSLVPLSDEEILRAAGLAP
jgi:hypothetical protein